MGGFWSRLFGSGDKRPSITQELSADPEKLNDVVDWFLTNEKGVLRHVSTVLHALLLLGYTVSEQSTRTAQLECRDGIDYCGLRNQTTFYISRRLEAIRAESGRLSEREMKALLQETADNLRETVVHLREYDKTGDDLLQLLQTAEPLAAEFQQQPNLLDAIPEFRARFDRNVFTNERRRHLGAVFVRKNLSEIAFYILCWLYYSWYDRQFYSPPLA